MRDNFDVIEEAAREIAVLDAEIKELTERRDMLKSHFKDGAAYPPGKYEIGKYVIVVSTNQRISQKKAEANLPASVLESISTAKVDTKKARALLPADALTSIMDNYENRIEVRVA